MRVIVRRERPHVGAQLSLLEEADGWHYQAFATHTASGQLAFLEAQHRAHARVEDRIRAAKDNRPGPVPLPRVQDQPDVAAARRDRRRPDRLAPAAPLSGDLATAEPKLLRFKMLHVPARLVRGGPDSRRRRIRV
jgi:hypothetical protein